MASDDTETRSEQAQKALQSAYENLPPDYPFGYFHYLDGPPAAGGGVGCFAWFVSRNELYAFVRTHQAWLGLPRAGLDPSQIQQDVDEIIEDLRCDRVDTEEARARLNSSLRHVNQIEWWGHFEDLLSGEENFPTKVRDWHKETTGKGPREVQTRQFFESLQEYGI